jgi:hypothetical protein
MSEPVDVGGYVVLMIAGLAFTEGPAGMRGRLPFS